MNSKGEDIDADDDDDEVAEAAPKGKKDIESDPIKTLMRDQPELAAQIRDL